MNILLASSIDSDAIEKLKFCHNVVCAFNAADHSLKALIKGCDLLVFRSGVNITAEIMECAPELQFLVRAGSGLDNLDVNYVRKRRLKLLRIPEPGARAVAELAFGLMLMLARQILIADSGLRKGHWLKQNIEGYVLKNKVLGIIGAGSIGATVGEMAASWGMRVRACVEHSSKERVLELASRGIELTSFKEILQNADFISLHMPLNDSTYHMIGPEEFRQMKQGAYLVNLARGGVVDENALFKALTEKGGLAGAAMDVHKREGEGCMSPLAQLSNVVLTPHIGATTVDTQREIGRRVVNAVETINKGFFRPTEGKEWRCNDDQQIQTA